jgi:Spy/CpxP family protein refolding chaperone
MWKKISPLLIILSAAMNVAFISAWITYDAKTSPIEDEARCEATRCSLHRYLKVTDEQWQRIEPRIAEFRRCAQTLCADIHRYHRELIDLIAAGAPDRQAIDAKQKDICAGQERMQQLVIEHLLAEKEVLTAEQEKELFDMFRQQCACGGLGRMMGLPGGESDTPAIQHDQSCDPDSKIYGKGEQP